jgi:hypothetical protein
VVRLLTVDYWTRALIDFKQDPDITSWVGLGAYGWRDTSFESWLWDTYQCRVSFEGAVTSAFFEFEDDRSATLFILKYGCHEHI